MNTFERRGMRHAAAALALLCCAWAGARAATTIVIVNENEPNVGFNDPTPAEPVGGNTGLTLGAQRMIAFQHAANIWGRTIDSGVPIRIAASFVPMACDETGAVLGAAGSAEIFSDFSKAPKAATWYPSALASKLAGVDVATPGQAHIRARFNLRLGLFPDCMPGSPFYLGIDNAHGDRIDLVAVLLHEIAHGLGFQNFTNEETGEQYEKLPSIWDFFLIDSRTDKLWADMTNDERRLSAISGPYLGWNGPRVKAELARVLRPASVLAIGGTAAGAATGTYEVGDASFGPALSEVAVSGELMPVVDQPDGSGLACTALSAENALAVRGNIALVDRGTCGFVVKALVVQNAGARGMLVAENAPGPVTPLGGADASITIPAVRIGFEAGQALKTALAPRAPARSGVIAIMGVDPNRLAGSDRARRIRMHSPVEYSAGSSVSHYTIDASPNQLMEPAVNEDLSHEVTLARDLTYPLLRDLGW